jgi:hypothetical protein
MPFNCHDCQKGFSNEPSFFVDVEVGSSTTSLAVGPQIGSATTRHYQRMPICSRCQEARGREANQAFYIIGSILTGVAAFGLLTLGAVLGFIWSIGAFVALGLLGLLCGVACAVMLIALKRN